MHDGLTQRRSELKRVCEYGAGRLLKVRTCRLLTVGSTDHIRWQSSGLTTGASLGKIRSGTAAPGASL